MSTLWPPGQWWGPGGQPFDFAGGRPLFPFLFIFSSLEQVALWVVTQFVALRDLVPAHDVIVSSFEVPPLGQYSAMRLAGQQSARCDEVAGDYRAED